MRIEWQDLFCVHIAQIDRQHRKIVKILDMIYWLEPEDHRGLEQIFDVLTAYIRRHFTDEESLMRVHGYPGYEEQKREHQRFVDQMRGYQEQFREGKVPVMINMFNNVWDWFAKHILVLDKQYEPYLRERGCR